MLKIDSLDHFLWQVERASGYGMWVLGAVKVASFAIPQLKVLSTAFWVVTSCSALSRGCCAWIDCFIEGKSRLVATVAAVAMIALGFALMGILPYGFFKMSVILCALPGMMTAAVDVYHRVEK